MGFALDGGLAPFGDHHRALLHFTIHHHLNHGRVLLDPHRRCGQRQGLASVDFNVSTREQTLAQGGAVAAGGRQAQIHQHRTAAALGAGVDAADCGQHHSVQTFHLQTCGLAHAHPGDVVGCQRRFQFQLANVHDLQNASVHAHTFTHLCQSGRHLPRNG